jgi:hypothetical protein
MGLSDLPNNIQKSSDAIPLKVRPSQTKRNFSGASYISNLCICTYFIATKVDNIIGCFTRKFVSIEKEGVRAYFFHFIIFIIIIYLSKSQGKGEGR